MTCAGTSEAETLEAGVDAVGSPFDPYPLPETPEIYIEESSGREDACAWVSSGDEATKFHCRSDWLTGPEEEFLAEGVNEDVVGECL